MEINKEALKDFLEIRDRIADSWPDGTSEVLQQRNPTLLADLFRTQDVLDSLLVIPSWPPALKKQWTTALAEYEKISVLCISYAKRHLKPQEVMGKTN